MNKTKITPKIFITIAIITIIFLPLFILYAKSIVNKNVNNFLFRKSSNNLEINPSDPLITRGEGYRETIKSPIISPADPSLGNNNAPIKIFQYSDYECKFCQEQDGVLKEILKKYGDRIQLFWKDYPETDPTSPSFKAAIAARCADEQAEFWTFHDLLYKENDKLVENTFLEIAQNLNLNINQFKKCLTAEKSFNLIKNNILEADSLGIEGVPFFFINKQEIMGEINKDVLEKIIETELNK